MGIGCSSYCYRESDIIMDIKGEDSEGNKIMSNYDD